MKSKREERKRAAVARSCDGGSDGGSGGEFYVR